MIIAQLARFRPTFFRILPVLVVFVSGQRSEAVAVDREVLLLVDVSKSVTSTDFSNMMSAYADSFASSDVIASLQSGEVGSIAASLVFYGDKDKEKNHAVGLEWMLISSETEALAFSDMLRTVEIPFKQKKKTSIAGGLDFAVPLFGTETGEAGNGFESEIQVIQITGDGIDDGSKPAGGSRETKVAEASARALNSGVDVINALTVGQIGDIDAYFAQYVIGGEIDGVVATVTNVEDFSGIGAVMQTQMLAVVPEPGLGMSLAAGLLVVGWRRRRTVS